MCACGREENDAWDREKFCGGGGVRWPREEEDDDDVGARGVMPVRVHQRCGQ